ncbi:MAG TPA: DUF488 family protein [Thermoplasmata archaeon]|nr:DUF488 family protein [Thermoplasmata archaeon]
MGIQLKRAYDAAAPDDGRRYLVDRLWPRGIRKDVLRLDAWLKELSPSNELRVWYHHELERFPQFRRRYREELARYGPEIDRLAHEAVEGQVTLVFSAREAEGSNAAVLRELIEERMGLAGSKGTFRRGSMKTS